MNLLSNMFCHLRLQRTAKLRAIWRLSPFSSWIFDITFVKTRKILIHLPLHTEKNFTQN